MKVPKGTAPEDFWPQMNMLSTKKSVKTTPGNMSAVFSVTMRCSPPLNVLYMRDETYPAMTPQKTKQSIIAVISPARWRAALSRAARGPAVRKRPRHAHAHALGIALRARHRVARAAHRRGSTAIRSRRRRTPS